MDERNPGGRSAPAGGTARTGAAQTDASGSAGARPGKARTGGGRSGAERTGAAPSGATQRSAGQRELAARDAESVARFVERFAAVMTDAGFPRMPARVFVALLATDSGRLTAAELAAQLSASPAAISGAVRYLTQVDMVTRRREPGSRRDHYEVLDDVWFEASIRKEQMYRRWSDLLGEGVAALGAHTPAGLRMKETRAFFDFLQDELPALVKRWRDYKTTHLTGDG